MAKGSILTRRDKDATAKVLLGFVSKKKGYGTTRSNEKVFEGKLVKRVEEGYFRKEENVRRHVVLLFGICLEGRKTCDENF